MALADTKPESRPLLGAGDPALWGLINGGADLVAGLPLTLTIGSGLVSGLTITAEMYFEKIGAMVEEFLAQTGKFSPEQGGTARARWAELGRDLTTQELERGDGTKRERYIYLQETVFVTDQRVVRLGFWRGQLSAVQGWTLGLLDL